MGGSAEAKGLPVQGGLVKSCYRREQASSPAEFGIADAKIVADGPL
jgi:hypothetical protein